MGQEGLGAVDAVIWEGGETGTQVAAVLGDAVAVSATAVVVKEVEEAAGTAEKAEVAKVGMADETAGTHTYPSRVMNALPSASLDKSRARSLIRCSLTFLAHVSVQESLVQDHHSEDRRKLRYRHLASHGERNTENRARPTAARLRAGQKNGVND